MSWKLGFEKVRLLRNRLQDAFFGWMLMTPDPDEFECLVDKLHTILPDVRRSVLYESLMPIRGVQLTYEVVKDICWRLAGNLNILKSGKPVWPWVSQIVDEWMPLHVTSINKGERELRQLGRVKRELGAWLTLTVLSGSACPTKFNRFWTFETCRYLARNIGFDKPIKPEKFGQVRKKSSYPFKDVLEFVDLRFNGLFTADTCKSGLNFNQVACSASQKKWNKMIISKRRGADRECPKNYSIDYPCYSCHVGKDECNLAVHKLTIPLTITLAQERPE